jgi:hypothetical protein
MAVSGPQALSECSLESHRTISMPLDHFRWLLMWHTAFARDCLLIEIERFGIEQARRNTRKLDCQRQEFLRSMQEKPS